MLSLGREISFIYIYISADNNIPIFIAQILTHTGVTVDRADIWQAACQLKCNRHLREHKSGVLDPVVDGVATLQVEEWPGVCLVP